MAFLGLQVSAVLLEEEPPALGHRLADKFVLAEMQLVRIELKQRELAASLGDHHHLRAWIEHALRQRPRIRADAATYNSLVPVSFNFCLCHLIFSFFVR